MRKSTADPSFANKAGDRLKQRGKRRAGSGNHESHCSGITGEAQDFADQRENPGSDGYTDAIKHKPWQFQCATKRGFGGLSVQLMGRGNSSTLSGIAHDADQIAGIAKQARKSYAW